MGDRARRGVGTGAGAMSAGRVTVTLGDLARCVVAAREPEQVELLAVVTARWEAGEVAGRRRWGWMGGSVGSGIEPQVLSEFIYPLLTGVFAQVLGTAAVAGWQRRWWRPRRGGLPSAPQMQVTLESDQIDAVRAACITHAMTLGLSRAKATLLADAVHGVLHQALAESRRQE